jgi:hypothetical protein
VKGCFIYLVNHTEQAVADGVRSLALLQANYLDRFPTPVLLFHEAGLTDEMRTRLAASAQVTFVPVDFSAYPNGTGYNHMCRFFAGEVFRQPALARFDYYCRLDTDSFINAPVGYDLFDFAQSAGVWYGFLNDAIHDNPEYCQGLWDAARKFGISTAHIPEGRLYYTNFEVCYLPWFRGNPWRAFYRFLDDAGGIYAHRWGDHTIRYIGVKALMEPERVKQLTGIAYSHQGIGAS